jgi:tricorn protease-like protein
VQGTHAWLIPLAITPSVVATCTPAAAGEAKPVSAGLIAFWSDDPTPSIWTIRPDGSGRSRILRNGQNAKRPRLSPDGQWVAFDGTPPGKRPMSDFDIQVVRPDGKGLRTLTRFETLGHAPAVVAGWRADQLHSGTGG